MAINNLGVRDIESKLDVVKNQISEHSKSHSASITNANSASSASSDSLNSGKILDSTPVRIRKSFASNFGISTQDILKHNIDKKSHEIILESGKIKVEEHEKLIKKAVVIIPGSSNNIPDSNISYRDFYFETNDIKEHIHKEKDTSVILEIIYYKLQKNEFRKISKKIKFNIYFNNEIPEIFLVKIPTNEIADKELYSYIKLIYNDTSKTFKLDSKFKKPVSYIYIKKYNDDEDEEEDDEEDEDEEGEDEEDENENEVYDEYEGEYEEDHEEDQEDENKDEYDDKIIYNIIKNQEKLYSVNGIGSIEEITTRLKNIIDRF